MWICLFLPPLIPLIGERAVLAVCGYLINNVAFVFAALYFYKLSATILKDPEVSLSASILFCFNPASIFYSSIWHYWLLFLELFGVHVFLLLSYLSKLMGITTGVLGVLIMKVVGFLRYSQLKSLPNFLFASPILSLAFCSIYYYAKSRPRCFFFTWVSNFDIAKELWS